MSVWSENEEDRMSQQDSEERVLEERLEKLQLQLSFSERFALAKAMSSRWIQKAVEDLLRSEDLTLRGAEALLRICCRIVTMDPENLFPNSEPCSQ